MAENYFDNPDASPKRRAPRKTTPKPVAPKANGHASPGRVDWVPNQHWREDLARTEGGKILRTLNNVLVALRQAPQWKDMFAWNQFSSRLMVMRHLPGTNKIEASVPREITGPDVSNVTDWMQHNGIIVASQTTEEGIRAVADEFSYHPVRDYLNGLTWDKTPRLETWLIKHLGVTDTALHRAFGSRWMIGLVARIFEPGCQLDTALILESRQGLRKSTALRVLAQPWFTDHVPDLSSKDALEQLQGVWIIELAELSSFGRVETARIKSFLSSRDDRFRPSFGRFPANHPRQCGFAGTVNPGSNGYLRDETGARRFWIVECATNWKPNQQVDVEKLTAARDHLWAEAVYRYREGKPWWLDTADLEAGQEAAAEARQTDDPREPKIRDYVEGLAWVRMDGILGAECLNIPPERWSIALRTEIGHVMSALKWKRKRKRTDAKKADSPMEWRYYPPGEEREREAPVYPDEISF
jgi:predicted P-loop ATPase